MRDAGAWCGLGILWALAACAGSSTGTPRRDASPERDAAATSPDADPDGSSADGAPGPDTAPAPRDGAPPPPPAPPPDAAPPPRDAATFDTGPDLCPGVPAPSEIASTALAGESPAGRHETVTVDGFSDDYLYDATDFLKIGTRREWGGSVVFFGIGEGMGPGTNDTNTIDANDTGREVQVAFYDPDRHMQGCAASASCASMPTSCPASITYLGWDPVQGGNRCNVGSGVESVDFVDGALRIATIPLFWNPNWDRADCESDSGCRDAALRMRRSDVRVVQTMRFVATHVVQLEYAIENLSDVDHRATNQEMPTLYSANGEGGPDLYRVMDSTGRDVPVDTPAGGDGFNYEDFESPDGWVALQNAAGDYGVGIYYENRLRTFQAWQLRSLPFNNVRARFSFGLPARGTVHARAYLVLGSYDTIAGQTAWLDGALGPFGWLDAPGSDEVVDASVRVSGWALDNRAVTSVTVLVDGVRALDARYGIARPDVCAAWPGYAGCDAVGYEATVDTSGMSGCHIVEVRARDADGNETTLGTRRIRVSR